MSVHNSDAIALARTLAAEFANEAPFTERGDSDSDAAIGQVADAIDPSFAAEKDALAAELEHVISDELFRKVDHFWGRLMAHHEDGGYLFGLAVGQLMKIPALRQPAGRGRVR